MGAKQQCMTCICICSCGHTTSSVLTCCIRTILIVSLLIMNCEYFVSSQLIDLHLINSPSHWQRTQLISLHKKCVKLPNQECVTTFYHTWVLHTITTHPPPHTHTHTHNINYIHCTVVEYGMLYMYLHVYQTTK